MVRIPPAPIKKFEDLPLLVKNRVIGLLSNFTPEIRLEYLQNDLPEGELLGWFWKKLKKKEKELKPSIIHQEPLSFVIRLSVTRISIARIAKEWAERQNRKGNFRRLFSTSLAFAFYILSLLSPSLFCAPLQKTGFRQSGKFTTFFLFTD